MGLVNVSDRPSTRAADVGRWTNHLRPLRELERPAQVFANLTPNWFASVMGTGIIAVAAASLPVQLPGLHLGAVTLWASAGALFLTLTVATSIHWRRHPATARGHWNDPVISYFYGAVPMAALTLGAATLLVGRGVLGPRLALDLDWALWGAGTLGGVLTAALMLPPRSARRPTPEQTRPFGGWLMPVVPPMVSASTGALLVPHTSAGPARLTLLLGCYALFGLSLAACVRLIPVICRELAGPSVGPARLAPTVWIVLGPLGQSVTAANLLGGAAQLALPAPCARALRDFGLAFGLPVWGLAALWVPLALAITVRTAWSGLPFSLAWWSFTFPVGTCVTASTGLWLHTGAEVFRIAAVGLFLSLLLIWLAVGALTVAASWSGWLFRGDRTPLSPAARSA
jgi:C4-dicarboxylate transporter/malic acid transport protein